MSRVNRRIRLTGPQDHGAAALASAACRRLPSYIERARSDIGLRGFRHALLPDLTGPAPASIARSLRDSYSNPRPLLEIAGPPIRCRLAAVSPDRLRTDKISANRPRRGFRLSATAHLLPIGPRPLQASLLASATVEPWRRRLPALSALSADTSSHPPSRGSGSRIATVGGTAGGFCTLKPGEIPPALPFLVSFRVVS